MTDFFEMRGTAARLMISGGRSAGAGSRADVDLPEQTRMHRYNLKG
jgi:hypothetical protein